jgi:hypothetical protein
VTAASAPRRPAAKANRFMRPSCHGSASFRVVASIMSCRPQESPRKSAKDVIGRPHDNLFTIIMKNGRTGFWGTSIAPRTAVGGTGPMKCRERLGGLLKFYNREAASPRGRIEWLHTTGKRVARSLS